MQRGTNGKGLREGQGVGTCVDSETRLSRKRERVKSEAGTGRARAWRHDGMIHSTGTCRGTGAPKQVVSSNKRDGTTPITHQHILGTCFSVKRARPRHTLGQGDRRVTFYPVSVDHLAHAGAESPTRTATSGPRCFLVIHS